jgi:hypothetical protein
MTNGNTESRDFNSYSKTNDRVMEHDSDIDDLSDIAATLESLKDRTSSPSPPRRRKSARSVATNMDEVETWYLSDFDLPVATKMGRKKKRQRDEDEEFQISQDIEIDSVAGSARKSRRRVLPNYRESSSEQDSNESDSEDTSFDGTAFVNDHEKDNAGSHSWNVSSTRMTADSSNASSGSGVEGNAHEATSHTKLEKEGCDDGDFFLYI